MIQRIQSLYLLVTAALMAMMLIFPLGRFLIEDQEAVLRAFGYILDTGDKISGTVYMGVLIVAAMVISFVNIFLYKNRILQIRLCFVNVVLLLGAQIFVIYYIYHASASASAISDGMSNYSVVDIFPLVGLVLTWLANKGIIKDETLVRSLDRIR